MICNRKLDMTIGGISLGHPLERLMFSQEEDSVFNYTDIAVFDSFLKEWLTDLILFSHNVTFDES